MRLAFGGECLGLLVVASCSFARVRMTPGASGDCHREAIVTDLVATGVLLGVTGAIAYGGRNCNQVECLFTVVGAGAFGVAGVVTLASAGYGGLVYPTCRQRRRDGIADPRQAQPIPCGDLARTATELYHRDPAAFEARLGADERVAICARDLSVERIDDLQNSARDLAARGRCAEARADLDRSARLAQVIGVTIDRAVLERCP